MGKESKNSRRRKAPHGSRSRSRARSRSRHDENVDRRRRSRRSSSRVDGPIERLADMLSVLAKTASGEPSRTARGEMIPLFNPEDRGQSAEMWCSKVDEVKEIFRWSEATTIYYALSRLRGLAEVWYKGLPTLKFSWSEWKIKIQAAFPSQRDFYEVLSDMMRRRKQPEESYAKYFYEKQALLNSCKIFGGDAVSCILGGITDPIVKTGAKAGNHQTPESLLNYLSLLNDTAASVSDRSERVMQKALKRRQHELELPQKRSRRAEQVTCFSCGKPGHKAKECRKSTSAVRCSYCRRNNHTEDNCYLKKRTLETVNVTA